MKQGPPRSPENHRGQFEINNRKKSEYEPSECVAKQRC